MSQSREDYVKFMLEHGGDEAITNKMIADGLNVSPASVSEMMQKLAKEGLVKTQRYRGSELTEGGYQIAQELVRKHEIWEYFLEQKLGYSKEEVHNYAEVLEHATPIELADRLARFIDFPENRVK
ncbi:metal-dependent transcriptional regulator [Aerococcaceae bacterium WGS1372]